MKKLLHFFQKLFRHKDPVEKLVENIKESADAVVLDEYGNIDPDEHLAAVLNAVMKTGGPISGYVDKNGKLHMKLPKKGKCK